MLRIEYRPTGDGQTVAWVVLDREGRSVNSIDGAVLDAVEALLAEVESDATVVGLVLISGKPESFVVGADVDALAAMRSAADVEAFARRGHRVLGRLARLDRPVVAAIHGACLGAGLELTLVCDQRVATDHRKTKLGLPEVQLGLLPGGGGLSRLPRLVGLRAALDLMLTGRSLSAKRARKMGLVDEVVDAAALEQAAAAAVQRLREARARPAVRRRLLDRMLDDTMLGQRVILRQARKSVLRKTRGVYPAPLRILDLVQQGIDQPLEAALELEPAAFARLAMTPESRALVALFRHSTALKRQVTDPESSPADGGPRGREVQHLGLLGGGLMGADIAAVAADRGIRVRMRDVSADALAAALSRVERAFGRRSSREGSAAVFQARARVHGTTELDGFEDVDLVIEAVPEDVELKRRVLAEAEAKIPATAVLASNTSALPIAELTTKLRRPAQVLGLHFFSPVYKMPLLEVVRAEATSGATLATALRFAVALGKTPIVVRDGAGFFTTRVLGFYMMRAVELLELGYRIEDIDDGARRVGWPVGPLTLLDEVGIDVGAKVAATLQSAFGDRLAAPAAIETFRSEDRLGRKNGRGMYRYPLSKPRQGDVSVYAAFAGRPAEPVGELEAADLGQWLTLVCMAEAIACLDEGVIACAADGDVGAVFGFGYPPQTGGPFRHADAWGGAELLERYRELAARLGTSAFVPDGLRQHADGGRTFHAEPQGPRP